MKKVIDFSTYKKIRVLSFNDFNRWITEVYKNAYVDGRNDSATLINEDCVAALTEDRLLEIIMSVKGIGRKRAEEAVAKILQEGLSYYGNET